MSRYMGVHNYDEKVFSSWVEEFYQGSDFYNMGYWREDTHDAQAACENLMEQLLAFLPEKTGNILDVACGKGATTRYLLQYYQPQDIIGINISAKQLERCRINAPNCKFIEMDATQLEFPDNSFNSLICVEAAFHFNTREKFLQEAYRVLKPGGYLLLSDLLMHEWVAKHVSHLHPENYVSNLDEYRGLYRRAGFENIELIDVTQECSVRYYKRLLEFLQKKFSISWSGKIRFETTKRHFLSSMNSTRYYLLASAVKL